MNRITKDLIISGFFLAFVYVSTNNPIVKPKIKEESNGMWRIEKLQHPLVFGLTGHNYLVLKSPDNNIVNEMHGLATDAQNGGWKYIGSNKTDLLKVWEFDGPRNYLAEKNYPGVVVSEGQEDTVKNLWDKARNCKEELNKKIINYPPYGVNIRGETFNSNSVAYTLLMCMNVDSKRVGLIVPGDKKNLLDR